MLKVTLYSIPKSTLLEKKNYRPVSLKYFFRNIWTISAWKSHKLRGHISFKVYFGLSQVLQFKSCINSLNKKLEKILRSATESYHSHEHFRARLHETWSENNICQKLDTPRVSLSHFFFSLIQLLEKFI